jgi:hypothetical protein
MPPSPKQIVYQEILRQTLPVLRNISTLHWWSRLRDRSAYYEAQLVHNLPVCLLEPEFAEVDIWFLNHHARFYCRECSAELSCIYPGQVERIRKLFTLVPEPMRSKLEWQGP